MIPGIVPIYQILVIGVLITGCKQNRSEIEQSHFNDPLTEAYIHDPSELQMENDMYMVFSTGNGVQSWFRNSNMDEWKSAGRLGKPGWWDEVFPGNIGHFWAPCLPSKWVLYYSFEAPFVYNHPENKYYYLFVNWGHCCRGVESTYQVMVGRSEAPTGPFIDKDGKNMLDEGGSMLLQSEGRYIGPGHAGIYRHSDGSYAISFHYYDGKDEGNARLAVRKLTWEENWPMVSGEDFFTPDSRAVSITKSQF